MSEIFGIEELTAAFEEMVKTAQEAAKTIVRRAQVELEAETKKSFRLSNPPGRDSHGRFSRSVSPPGSPPAVVTGTLRRSITSSKVEVRATSATGTVYPTAVYARIQELGGIAGHGAHLPARPYLAPALEKTTPRMQEIATEEWAKGLRL